MFSPIYGQLDHHTVPEIHVRNATTLTRMLLDDRRTKLISFELTNFMESLKVAKLKASQNKTDLSGKPVRSGQKWMTFSF